ncbi:DUF4145 domain-containing protein [Brevibacillus laterosporus]|uniref:DUF4145 domain-containing protein n=1 Tax=Brevibacillus laterosporus TaxID=1465 RepID=UPI0003B18E9A|nr:DUF4145 domain-containing protein [Brevibacillus laterosporus]ERM20331.1 hypothetical protein P615_00030 [Brevibacillus laterosporus PE36]
MLKRYAPNNAPRSTITYKEPNQCWYCHNFIDPTIIYSHVFDNMIAPGKSHKLKGAASLLQCPSCSLIFLGVYELKETGMPQNFNGALIYSAPKLQPKINFPETINDISPNFIEIYKQSLQAEKDNLNQIAGMGYRKALEFLIKDYLTYKHPDKEEKIKKQTLSECIKTHIEDKYLNSALLAAVWIGNDETHYIKKHTDKDVNNIKAFIEASVYFISSEISAVEAMKFIES